MAVIARPFDDPANSITEATWWQMAALWAPDGVVPGTGGGPGVGELEVYATGSEYAVRVRPGSAYIQGIYVTSSAEETLVPGAPPAGSGSVRTDYVVLRVLWGAAGVPLHAEFGLITNLPGLATPGNVVESILGAVNIPHGAGALLPAYVVPMRTWTGPQSSIPVGTIVGYPVATPPPGWLLCDGRAVSRTEYSRLFAALLTAYGAGDGTTTFNLPDMRGRVLVGLDNLGLGGAGVLPAAAALNASGGAATGTLSPGHLPSHTHGFTLDLDTQPDNPPHGHTVGVGDVTTDTVGASHAHDVTVSGTTDPATAHRHAIAASGTSVNVSAGVYPVPAAGAGYTEYEAPPHSHTATLTGSTTGATGGHAHTVPLGTLTTSGITANHTHHLAAVFVTGGAGAAAPAAFDLTQPWLAGAYLIKT